MRSWLDRDEDGKIYMTFELRAHGKTQTIMCEYEDDVHWSEVIDDVVKQVESSWGYTFDLEKAGIYYKGKKVDE